MILKSKFSKNQRLAIANVRYISRKGALGDNRASLYDRQGQTLNKDDFRTLMAEIRSAKMERRIILSPQNPNMGKREINFLVRDTIERYQVQNKKKMDYVFAVHDHNGRIHAHILAWGTKAALSMSVAELNLIRDLAQALEIRLERQHSFTPDQVPKQHNFNKEMSRDI